MATNRDVVRGLARRTQQSPPSSKEPSPMRSAAARRIADQTSTASVPTASASLELGKQQQTPQLAYIHQRPVMHRRFGA